MNIINQSFFIQGNPAHGEGVEIPLEIGNVGHCSSLDEEAFADLCEVINRVTLKPRYPNGWSRANHNGTHSARQARMMEVLLRTGMKIDPLTSEEEFLLKLAAYLLRAGRIDESSHEDAVPDDYYTRSAMIFEAYARQLKCSEETVVWIKNLIVNSCKPSGVRDPAIDENQKWKKCWDFLVAVHELDLIRCFSRAEIDRRILLNTQERLVPYGFSSQEVNRLLLFSKKLCEATGCARTYDNHPGNSQRFKVCSREGKRCWNIVKNIIYK